jgi:hypothetical protein
VAAPAQNGRRQFVSKKLALATACGCRGSKWKEAICKSWADRPGSTFDTLKMEGHDL